jgi:glycosyltransferase involved in cell wall biosynthesis
LTTLDHARNVEAPLISVILCTRNRADLFEKAMASLVQQEFPSTDYEIIVVDNASTDRTPEIARRFQEIAPVRYFRETRLGLCIARNTGWQNAAGRYIAFFDDDAIARPGWLRAIWDAFERWPKSAGVIGGRVEPIWQGARPPWLSNEIAGSLTIVDWGPSEKIIEDIGREWLVGANMAVPKAVLFEVGGFHPWLDRVGDKLISSGDVFLQKEVMRRGYQCLYVPSVAIEHLVPPSRLNRKWFLQRFYWQGVSDAVMQLIERTPSPTGRILLALARIRTFIRSRSRIKALIFPAKSPDAFRLKCFALIDIGYIMGLLGAAHR